MSTSSQPFPNTALPELVAPSAAGAQPDLERRLSAVLAVTRAVFGREPKSEVLTDPEDSDRPFIVVEVSVTGNARELLRMRDEWHRRVEAAVPGHTGLYRLSLDPQ